MCVTSTVISLRHQKFKMLFILYFRAFLETQFLENYKIYHGPINIGHVNEMQIIEIADFISDTLKIDKNYIFQELPNNDPKIRKPDISKINKIFNWKPKIDLKEGIVNTINYFRETI